MSEKFFRIEAVVERDSQQFVEVIEVARIQGDVSESVILDRHDHTCRAVLRARGFSDEEAEAAELRTVETDRDEFDAG